jgi:hypothetical protein
MLTSMPMEDACALMLAMVQKLMKTNGITMKEITPLADGLVEFLNEPDTKYKATDIHGEERKTH